MKKLILPTLLLSLLTTTAAQAGTASTATAGFSNFSYSLIDLDLNDGIAASLSFGTAGFGATAGGTLTLSGSPYNSVDSFNDAAGGALHNLSSSSSQFASSGSGGATVTAGAGGGLTGASGMATAVIKDNSPSRYTSYDITSQLLSSSFTLSPHTLLVLNVNGSATADNDPTLSAYGRAQIISTTWLSVSGPIGNTYQDSHSLVRAEADTRWASQSVNQSMTVSFANFSTDAVTGNTSLYSNIRGTVTNISAVPEPETYGMLLAGLGVMGLIARRRQRA
jgi:hypothetical protein